MGGTLFGSIIELIFRLSYDETERLVLKIQHMQSNSTQGNAKLISKLRKRSLAKVLLALIVEVLMLFGLASSRVVNGIAVRTVPRLFSNLTATPLARTRYPNKWICFIDCMLQGLPLRKSAEILDVSHVTLFYWRHSC